MSGIDVPLVSAYAVNMAPTEAVSQSVTEGRLPERPLRADARRNRARVLAAARLVFSEHGRDAQMDDVARQAQVGVGTVYRHFPTKETLIEALVRDRIGQIEEWAREALGTGDPWEAFTTLMWRSAELHAEDRALSEATAEAKPRLMQDAAELQALITQVMDRAKAAGALREDIGPDDLPMVMCGLAAAIAAERRPGDWRTYMTVLLDGLRADARAAR
jgi:AcrR family transcriptional regulator